MIEQLNKQQGQAVLDALTRLLQNVVDDGASIGFLAPLKDAPARAYWQDVFEDVEHGKRVILVAVEDGQIVGSIQLDLPHKPNATHRAEVQKLMVHTSQRGRGLGKQLLAAIEGVARREGRRLLVLDTRRGDVAEQMYSRYGYTVAGIIPQYALRSGGGVDDTVLFYRILE